MFKVNYKNTRITSMASLIHWAYLTPLCKVPIVNLEQVNMLAETASVNVWELWANLTPKKLLH